MAMVTVFKDRKFTGFELPGVDLCKPYKHNDDSQHRCVFQGKKTNRRLSQSMAMVRNATHVEDGRDVVLDLVALSRDAFQKVYSET